TEQISDYIRKCCISGLRCARIKNGCDKIDTSGLSISRIWLGLCSSTFGVCCSRELDHQNCELGRLAALGGIKCDNADNSTSSSYSNCCRACQVGLAVKASKQKCTDPLFSFLSNIDSYRICCSDSFTDPTTIINKNEQKDDGEDSHQDIEPENKSELSRETADGTIVLTDDDDICRKIPNLCAQICENTFDAYRCRCWPGFHLDDNNVTCTKNKDNITKGKSICPDGYSLDEAQGKCVDIDECKEQLHACEPVQYCHNRIGGYRCLDIKDNNCQAGFLYNNKTNECEENSEGRYQCIPIDSQDCGTGYYLRDGSCKDIDECFHNVTNSCLNELHQECKNTIGSYYCNCIPGYSLDAMQNKCIDINECSINNHNCLPTQRCDNTIGSYICTRWTSCGTGYTLNAETGNCDDDNECALKTHNCDSNYECFNTKGSFRCHKKITTSATTPTTTTLSPPTHHNGYRNYVAYQGNNRLDYKPSYILKDQPCSIGFHRDHLGACVDINECLAYKPCMNHERCINSNGSYRCETLLQCPAGYKSRPDASSCVDIDECETGDNNCGDRQICRNRIGGYICTCPTGHVLSRLKDGSNTCMDINECIQDQPACSSNAQCFNTIGSFYCECKPGFQKKTSQDTPLAWQSHTQCFDVDECLTISGLCQQKCVNFWGGYRCTCHHGYELAYDNRTCTDIDECEVHKEYNLCMGFCINSDGSYQCTCPRGYILAADKSSCQDIDECGTNVENGNHVCTGRNDICTNIRGSFKCTAINCPAGYINDPEQKNRCRQSSQFCDGEECYTKPSAYTFNFITFVSKLLIPPDGRPIFTLRGPIWYDDIDFDLKMVRSHSASNIEKANESYFDTLKNNNQVNLILKKSLEGPQDIELDLSMTVFTNGMPRGKSVAKIFLFVSQYTF
ncbi:hypothetical protein KR222_000115, partial [Zaprionus bogoriensis]